MHNILLSTSILFIALVFPQIQIRADEIDLEKNIQLFTQMFGKEYTKVKTSSTKKDDATFGLELLENAAALQSKPGLQTYIKYQAALLLRNSIKLKKKARELLSETLPDLPDSEQKLVKKELLTLQKKILTKTSRKNKNGYLVEVETYVSFSQVAANDLIKQSNYPEAIKILRDGLRYLKMVDKTAAAQFNKQIKSVMQDSKRFNQINSSIKLVKRNPNDTRANLALANYYFIEKGDLYKAWPYFEKSGDETLLSFFKNIKSCLDDHKLKTSDGISMSTYPMLHEHPEKYLQWLSTKDLEDPANLMSAQLNLIKNKKEINKNQVKLIVLNTVKRKGKEQSISYKTYIDLAKNFKALTKKVTSQKNINKNSAKFMIDQLVSNQYIALSKAKIKLVKDTTVDEVLKLKLDMDIGKCTKVIDQRGIDSIDVKLKTPFLFQRSLGGNTLNITGGNTYTFDPSNWKKFNKDFDILINRNPFSPKDTSSLKNKEGQLIFLTKATYLIKSKKKKWNANIEVSFELTKLPEQTVDIQLLLKPNDVRYKKTFCVYYHVFSSSGWYGIMKDGEEIHDFFRSKLTRAIRNESERKELYKEGKLKISAVFKNKTFDIFLNNKLFISSPIEKISKEKGFPNTPIQIYIVTRDHKIIKHPIKIDNLYIGPPKNKK